MHEKRFTQVERLRTPQRTALLEVQRVTDLSLEGISVGNVLVVGTGSALFAEEFAGRGLEVAGIDPNEIMLEAARKFVPHADFKQGTAEVIPYPDKTFDLVILGHVLHETDEPLKALQETLRVASQRVVVVEWPYQKEEMGPPLEHRLQPDEVIKWGRDVGFKQVAVYRLAHMVLFRLEV